MKANSRLVILSAAAAVVITAVGVAANFATGSGIREWNDTGSWVSAIAAGVGVVVAAISTFLTKRAEDADEVSAENRERLAFRLIRTFAEIERESLLLEDAPEGAAPRRPLSLREVRAMMSAAQVWDHQDRIGFDLATRARNAIVHGDLERLDLLDLKYANEKAQQLLDKIRRASRSQN